MSKYTTKLAEQDISNLLHPFTNLTTHQKIGPTIIAKAKDIYVYDEFGNKYIEGLAGL